MFLFSGISKPERLNETIPLSCEEEMIELNLVLLENLQGFGCVYMCGRLSVSSLRIRAHGRPECGLA